MDDIKCVADTMIRLNVVNESVFMLLLKTASVAAREKNLIPFTFVSFHNFFNFLVQLASSMSTVEIFSSKKKENFQRARNSITLHIKAITTLEFILLMKILSLLLEIFAEPNWGLPLAIAANLHTPYRIEVGIEEILNIELKDKEGKGKVEKLSAAENFLIFIQF